MMHWFLAEAKTFDEIVFDVNRTILNPLIQFAFLIAFVVFLWGMIEFLRNANNAEKRKEGQNHILWSVVGFSIMLGVYGIIKILIGTFELGGGTLNNNGQEFKPPALKEIKIR